MSKAERLGGLIPRWREKLTPETRKRLLIAALKGTAYGLLAYVSLALIAYGLAWKQFATGDSQETRFGGIFVTGKISDLTTFGFGQSQDVFFHVEGSPDEFVIPGSIVGDVPIADILEDLEDKGEPISVRSSGPIWIDSSGEKRRVAFEVSTPSQRYLDYAQTSAAYIKAKESAASKGTVWIILGVTLFPAGLLGVKFGPAAWRKLRARSRKA